VQVAGKPLPEPLGPKRSSETNVISPHITPLSVLDNSLRSSTPDGMMSQTPPNIASRSRTSSPEAEKTISPKGYVPSDLRSFLHYDR
jgi:hypothetical protein